MSKLKFCLITPSYKPDFARCRLLVESVDRFAISKTHHYIIVPRKDFKLFQQLESPMRTIITVESILPWWIQKIPILKNGWFSWKTQPIRNWLLQQIVKLEIANYISEDVLIFVDSDTTFVRAFDHQNFVKEGKVRLLRESINPSSLSNLGIQVKWCDTAISLLNLPPLAEFNSQNPFIIYGGQIITWKRENVLLLHQHIERVAQKSWIEVIAECWNLAEYQLYGIFVDRVLKEKSGHYWKSQKITHEYWGVTPLDQEQLQQFIREIPPESLAVMISAKSKTPVDSYASLLRGIRDF